MSKMSKAAQCAARSTLRKRTRKSALQAEILAAKLALDQGMSLGEAAKLAGLGSIQQVKTSVAREEGRREILAELRIIDPETLNLTAKQKLGVAKRQIERQGDVAIATRMAQIEQEVQRRVKAAIAARLATLNKHQDEAIAERDLYRERTNKLQPIFTIDDWRVLVKAVHGNEAARNRASDLLTTNKFKLTGER